MNHSLLKQYSTLTFDCYGTLIDWESGIWDALQPLLMANEVTHIVRQTGLEAFAIAETRQEVETPGLIYSEILRATHQRVAAAFELTSNADLDQRFGDSVKFWPAFPDTADALRILKQHFKLVILSNVNRDGFAASNTKLGVEFDAIYTAEDVGSYKPDPANFEYMLEHIDQDLGVKPEQILHTAQSLHHDHVQATKFGLATAWIDRQFLKDGDNWGATAKVEQRPELDFVFNTMGQMAAAAEQAFSQQGAV